MSGKNSLKRVQFDFREDAVSDHGLVPVLETYRRELEAL